MANDTPPATTQFQRTLNVQAHASRASRHRSCHPPPALRARHTRRQPRPAVPALTHERQPPPRTPPRELAPPQQCKPDRPERHCGLIHALPRPRLAQDPPQVYMTKPFHCFNAGLHRKPLIDMKVDAVPVPLQHPRTSSCERYIPPVYHCPFDGSKHRAQKYRQYSQPGRHLPPPACTSRSQHHTSISQGMPSIVT